MSKDLTPHFSRKILFLSFIFLLANLGIYALRHVADQQVMLKSLAPKLISANIEEIEVRSTYEEDYRAAQPEQELFSGSWVRTGEKEFAELILGSNIIKLDEQTELRIAKNNTNGSDQYFSRLPRLELELVSGGIWVNAFDLIEVHQPRSISRFHHSVGILTYASPINRHIVVTGDASLSLLNEKGEVLSEFVIPLHNQVTFIDSQITEAYAALKPSKLKKELKMTAISDQVLEDEWVIRNVSDTGKKKQAFEESLITSGAAYRIKSIYQKALSYLTFAPEAKRDLSIAQAETMLSYLLGGIEQTGDQIQAKKIIEDFDAFIEERKSDPQIQNLIVETLFAIENAEFSSPSYLLRESLMARVAEREGTYVFRIYLTDLRRALFEGNEQTAQSIAKKWLDSWTEPLTEKNTTEFDRQSQILNHTLLSYIDSVPLSILDIFDETGARKMAYAQDLEEARFEVTSDRLQIAASLISSYRYILAKQYLKNSYLSLNIEGLSSSLASTQIFLENGKLLAQRIEYAEDVLHGAARPIDETKFFNYFQTIKRDEALSEDLREFFELGQEEIIDSSLVDAPTAAQVAEKFLDARINVNYADISLKPEGGFIYQIENARLIDRGSNNETLSFDATYDFTSNSVIDVVTSEKTYQGAFTLTDIVTVLKTGGELESKIPAPRLEEGIELLITDQEKIEALEGQAIAQDVAKQLAYNNLTANGIIIPEVKFGIEILDLLNLNQFKIKGALIPRTDGKDAIMINFDYQSTANLASNIVSEEGVILLEEANVTDMAEQVLAKVLELEKELQVIGAFNTFVKQNELFIDSKDILYTEDGLLSLKNLELLTLGLSVSGLYDPESKQFVSVAHELVSGQDVEVKEYFELLADQHIVSFMAQQGFLIAAGQVDSNYPFKRITINQLSLEGELFTFELDIEDQKALKIKRVGSETLIDEMTLDELKALPAQIRSEEAGTPESE